nr:hypothetical protein Iba_chr04cCG1240 [Ipomoea batatas]
MTKLGNYSCVTFNGNQNSKYRKGKRRQRMWWLRLNTKTAHLSDFLRLLDFSCSTLDLRILGFLETSFSLLSNGIFLLTLEEEAAGVDVDRE